MTDTNAEAPQEATQAEAEAGPTGEELAAKNLKFITEIVGGDGRLAALLQPFADDGIDLYNHSQTASTIVALLCSYLGLFHRDALSFVNHVNLYSKGAVETSIAMARNFQSYQMAAKAPDLSPCGDGCSCGGQL